MTTPQDKTHSRSETSSPAAVPAPPLVTPSPDPAANRGTWIGFLVWVVGFLFLLLLMWADLIAGLFFRR